MLPNVHSAPSTTCQAPDAPATMPGAPETRITRG